MLNELARWSLEHWKGREEAALAAVASYPRQVQLRRKTNRIATSNSGSIAESCCVKYRIACANYNRSGSAVSQA
jgi:hypothetical protein